MSLIKTIALVSFHNAQALDIVVPFEIFVSCGYTVYLVTESIAPFATSSALTLTPTHSFETCPDVDFLVAVGGSGLTSQLASEVMLNFLRKKAESAKWIGGVCAGALLLAAAGLLDGYKATTHWASLYLLRKFKVTINYQQL